MKSILFSITTAILALAPGCLQAWAQEKNAPSIELEAVARLESNPKIPLDGGKMQHGFGSSSIYTNVSASFGEHWSASWVSHWAGTDGGSYPFAATKDLYKNILRSTNNFLDYLYVDYTTGGWTLRLGKDCQALGGFQYDDWDWTVDNDLASQYWQNNCSYRWGGSLLWTSQDKVTTLQLQAISSPDHGLDEQVWRPWHKGYGMYTFKYSSDYENIITSSSVAWAQYGPDMGKAVAVLGLGGDINDRFTLRGEFMGRFGTGTAAGKNSLTSVVEALWSPSESWDFRFKCCYDRMGLPMELSGYLDENPDKVSVVNTLALGCTVAFYPLKRSRDLRLHATAAYNDYTVLTDYSHSNGILLTIGVIYDHVFKLK